MPDKHDKFRGLPNAHDLTMAGIEACRQAGLPFQLHTTVVDWNRDEVCAITDFAVEIGAIAHYVFFLIPVGRGKYIQETSLRGAGERGACSVDIMAQGRPQVPIDVKPTCAPQFTRVAKQLGVETRFTRGCLAGLTYCVVGSEGIVRPCAYMTEEAGDVREQPFDEIWKTGPVFERLRTAGLLRLLRHLRLSRRLRRLPGPRRLLPRRRHPRARRLLRAWAALF